MLALVACRSERRPRDASHGTRADVTTLTDGGAPSPPPRRATVDARNVTGWAELTSGVRWRRGVVRVVSVEPPVEREAPPPEALHWVEVRVDVARAAIAVERCANDSITTQWQRDSSALAIFNGAYFEPDYRPSGLVLSGGVTAAPVGPRGGSGILRVASGRVDVVPIDARGGATFTPAADVSMALQCGPRVIEAGGVPGIYRHDGRYAARTVACVRDHGATLDLIAAWDVDDDRRGPELHDLATLLASPSPLGGDGPCETALNLDGGPSTGVYVRARAQSAGVEHAPVGPTPWALVVRPRP